MKKNMGKTDIRMRIIAALIILMLYFFGLISGTVGVVLLVLAAIFLVTSAIGHCPLYRLFGLSTRRKTKGYLD